MTESKLRVKTLFKSLSARISSLFGDEMAVLSGEIRLKPIALPAVMDCCISMVCESGSADFADEMGSYQVTPMTALSVIPGHRVTAMNLSDFRGIMVIMSPPLLEEVLGYYILPLRDILNQTRVERVPGPYVEGLFAMSVLFKSICDYGGGRRYDGMVHLLASMVSSFAPVFNVGKLPSGNPVVREFLKILDADTVQVSSLADYAKRLSVSPGYLSALIKDVTGRSFQEWMSSAVIHRARILLGDDTKSINDISYSLGFHDSSNFIRYFKSHYGMTPGEFRKALSDNPGERLFVET